MTIVSSATPAASSSARRRPSSASIWLIRLWYFELSLRVVGVSGE